MKLTNRAGLPEFFTAAVSADPYTKGDANISVTTLIDSPRVRVLKEQHADELVVDVLDCLASLKGQALHKVIERADIPGVIRERRLTVEIAGWKVSGAIDAYDPRVRVQETIWDFKTMSVAAFGAKFKGGTIPPDMEAQLNCYCEMTRSKGEPVNRLALCVWLEGWISAEATRNRDYPQSPVVTFQVPVWSREETQRYMHDRVVLHQQAEVELPLCSPKERWSQPTQYKVFKQGGKRAVKNYDTEAEAHGHAAQDPALFVVKVPGQSVRCERFCAAAQFCDQFRIIQGAVPAEAS
jgi:acetyl/propionyl-CoA carboxylase alpha subunit